MVSRNRNFKGRQLVLSSGSVVLDELVQSVKKFEREDPVTTSMKICMVCEKFSGDWSPIFLNDPWCCDICRKVYVGDLTPEEADKLIDNLTNKSK